MVTKNNPDNSAPDDSDWDVISEAAATIVAFDEVGDKFRGIKRGVQVIEDPNTGGTWNQWQFTGIFPDELAGELCGINGTYQLDRDLAAIPDGMEVQVTYVKDVPTRKGNPLKSFQVLSRKPKSFPHTAS